MATLVVWSHWMMPTLELESEDEAKLQWLRAAAKEGFDQLDRGEGVSFESTEDLASYIRQIGAEVSAELAAERECG